MYGACGYEYDPAVGDPDHGIEPGTAFKDLRMIGRARCAVKARTLLKQKQNKVYL